MNFNFVVVWQQLLNITSWALFVRFFDFLEQNIQNQITTTELRSDHTINQESSLSIAKVSSYSGKSSDFLTSFSTDLFYMIFKIEFNVNSYAWYFLFFAMC